MGTGFRRSLRVALAGSLPLGGALTTSVLLGAASPASATVVVGGVDVYGPPQGISSDGTHVWVATCCVGAVGIPPAGRLVELNASEGSFIGEPFSDLGGPQAVSSDGIHVWVTNESGGYVTELNASDGSTVQDRINVGGPLQGVSSDGTHVWVTSGNSVTELNASDGSVVQTIGVGSDPWGISSDGTHVWVANSADNTVSELNASDGSVVQTIAVGASPVAVSSDGTHVWVANSADNTVSELNASDGSVVHTIAVGNDPDCISADGTHVWVGNYNDETVSEITLTISIATDSLPPATPGAAYSPVTLQAADLGTSASPYTTSLRWKKITLPRGLRLSSIGVLSGTPNKKLAAGPSSATVQVTETVTTLNTRHRPVKAKTTVEATIPLTIN
jgi:YVTN family beta-propeller protein